MVVGGGGCWHLHAANEPTEAGGRERPPGPAQGAPPPSQTAPGQAPPGAALLPSGGRGALWRLMTQGRQGAGQRSMQRGFFAKGHAHSPLADLSPTLYRFLSCDVKQ